MVVGLEVFVVVRVLRYAGLTAYDSKSTGMMLDMAIAMEVVMIIFQM
jgi:hypothetical protein